MSERAVSRMSVDEFLEWGLHQSTRYELVDGVPVAMAGAKRRHDQIVANLHGLLFTQLRGHKCRYFTVDTAIRIPAGNIRRPDAGIDCGKFDDDAMSADQPYLVVEVLSPSTRDFDMFGKLDEYKTVAGLAHIVLIDPDTPQAIHWSRTSADAWRHELIEGLDQVVELPELPCLLDLATLYAGLTFVPRPRLVREGEAETEIR
jgi:Uma2 family endonuclease